MSRKKKILVVEDDSTIAQGLKELLQSEDYTVTISANGKDALKKTFVFRPDLILLDINLPTISGFEVCNQVRARGFRNPIIMLTARKEQIDKLRGLDIGANDYVTKPFDGREVLARVRAQLRSPAPPPPGLPGQRKLLSVMFTDIKGYSKKMNEDEKLALALLKIHNDKINRVVAANGGRVIENVGDEFLVSFESALKAVECGAAIQRELKKYNLTKPKQDHIHVRIGIHLGDVIEMDGKLKGDTINIAARLQQIAVPGHLNISESVYDAIRGRLKIRTFNLGSRKVKNIKQPITVFRVTI